MSNAFARPGSSGVEGQQRRQANVAGVGERLASNLDPILQGYGGYLQGEAGRLGDLQSRKTGVANTALNDLAAMRGEGWMRGQAGAVGNSATQRVMDEGRNLMASSPAFSRMNDAFLLRGLNAGAGAGNDYLRQAMDPAAVLARKQQMAQGQMGILDWMAQDYKQGVYNNALNGYSVGMGAAYGEPQRVAGAGMGELLGGAVGMAGGMGWRPLGK